MPEERTREEERVDRADRAEPAPGTAPVAERTVREAPAERRRDEVARTEAPRRETEVTTIVDRSNAALDRIRWGPIVGGIMATIATMLVLNVLGLAIGLSVLDPNAPAADLWTMAGLWGAAAALIAFFVGGWLAGRSAAPSARAAGSFTGMVNGAMVWATTLVILLVLGGLGAGGVLGFVGATFDQLAEAVGFGDGAAGTALDTAIQGAWGTLIALVLTLAVAMLGGLAGHASRGDDRRPARY